MDKTLPFLIPVVFLIAVVLISKIWRRLADRRTQEIAERSSLAEVAREALLPTFKVVALGASGAGKTVLLASIYHRLQTPAHTGYYLTVPRAQMTTLNKTYRHFSNPKEGWPPGTKSQETREFTFTCVARAGGEHHEVAQINYLDYAGELITEEQQAGASAQEELDAHISSADAALILIDGFRIKQLLEGSPEGEVHLESALKSFIQLVFRAKYPIHFVITKWDLISGSEQDDREKLSAVRELLLSNPHFRALVKEHGERRVVRLIPVSAVGRGFARVDERGHIVKHGTVTVRPAYVELPLSVVIPDIFSQRELSIEKSARDKVLAEIEERLALNPHDYLANIGQDLSQPTARALRASLGAVPGLTFGDQGLELFVQWLSRPLVERRALVFNQLGEANKQSALLSQSRQLVLEEFRRQINLLEAKIPASVLSGESRS